MTFADKNHRVKHRTTANDIFYTPVVLAKECIDEIPASVSDSWLDPAYGKGAFYDNFPTDNREWCEIAMGRDFFTYNKPVDWIVSNPPFSQIDEWLEHTLTLSQKGFGYILGWNNITAKRLEMVNNKSFFLTKVHMFKVFQWFGMSAFLVFEKNKKNIISYNRTVWRGRS